MKVIIKKEVDVFTLDAETLLSLSKGTLVDAVLEAGTLLRAAKPSDEEDFAMPETALAFDVEEHRDNGYTGVKFGKTSKYHYVYFNKNEKAYIGQVNLNGKNVRIARSKDEVEAALAVDKFLDEIGDPKRPRNYDEFPEVRARHERDN